MEIGYLDFLESYISSDETFDNIESILNWLKNIRDNSFSEVREKPLNDLKNSLNDTNLRIFFMVGNLRCVATTYN